MRYFFVEPEFFENNTLNSLFNVSAVKKFGSRRAYLVIAYHLSKNGDLPMLVDLRSQIATYIDNYAHFPAIKTDRGTWLGAANRQLILLHMRP
jgi:hypothetical protein